MAAALQIWSPTFSKAFDSLPAHIRDAVQRRVDEMGARLANFPHQRLQGRPEWSERDERHARQRREGVRSSAAGAAEIQSGSRRFFLHHGFLGDDDFWELHDVGDRRGSILTEGRLERQFSISDLG